MANHTSLASLFTDIANAIRAKLGSNASIVADNFPAAIQSIAPTLQTVTKTYTPTESAQTDTITPGSGYDGINEVDVTVDAVSSTYVGSGITRRSSSDLSASGATVTAPAGYYQSAASKAVQSGTAGTPTASKGAVSNHQVTVTPSVQNSAGYISGGTKTGTGVVVTAAELVSGSETKTQNGTFDVTNLAELVINVSGGGGGGLEYETGIWSPSSDVTTGEILFTNTHNQPPFFFVITDVDGDQHTNRTNTNAYAVFVNWNRILGTTIYPSSSSTRIGSLTGGRRTTQSTSLTAVTINFIADSNAATYATNTSIRPFLNSSTYWRTGYNYKWIAVWEPTT